jgi:hypothetical protein
MLVAVGILQHQKANAEEGPAGKILDLGVDSAMHNLMEAAPKADKISEVIDKYKGKAFQAIGDVADGRKLGQSWVESGARASVGYLASEAGMGLALAACPETLGAGCAIAAGVVLVAAGREVALGSWDWYQRWADDRSKPPPRLNRADSSVLGDPCLDYNVIGEVATCADGSFTPIAPQSPMYPPMSSGKPPEWMGIGR